MEVSEDVQVECDEALAVKILNDAWQLMQESSSEASTRPNGLFIPTRRSEYHAWHQAMFQTYVTDKLQYQPTDSIVAERQYEWIMTTKLPREQLRRSFSWLWNTSEFFNESETSKYFPIEDVITDAPVELDFASNVGEPTTSFTASVKQKDVSVLAPIHNCLPKVASAFCRSNNANELEQNHCSVEKQIALADTNPVPKHKPSVREESRKGIRAKLNTFRWENLVRYDDENVGGNCEMLGSEGEGGRGGRGEEGTTMPHSSNRLAISDSPPLMQHQPDGMLIRNNPAVRTCMPISSSGGIIAEPTLLMAVKENAPHGRQSKQCQRAEESDVDSVCYFDLQMSFAEEEESACGALPETPVISPASAETLLVFNQYQYNPGLYAIERTNVEE